MCPPGNKEWQEFLRVVFKKVDTLLQQQVVAAAAVR